MMRIKITGVRDGYYLPDVTVGKVYSVAGIDEDGEAYFYDDVGDRNWALGSGGGYPLFELAED